jgi:hypothetical protein
MGSLKRCVFLFAFTYECHVTCDIPYVLFRTEDDAPSHSLKDSNASLKVEIVKGKGVGVRPLVRSTLEVKGCAGAPRWGLRQMTSKLIIYTNLHKPNNKLVSVWLEHFWCTNEPRAYMDSQDSPQLRLGGSHHLPPYNILCAWPRGLHPNVILSRNSQVGSLEIP